ncbi:MAG TPA: hypothetical protein VNE86_02145 [Nitrososphaerales archaeon]|nr:hypothetical protein [Nitrososphaerales archaeon]
MNAESKGLLIHIGADTSNDETLGIVGPVFHDNQFEFIPIVETMPRQGAPTYRDIRCTSRQSSPYNRNLSFYVREPLEQKPCHYDPNPEGFTYSEPPDARRGKQLLRLLPDDFIFFVASLAQYSEESYREVDTSTIRRHQAGQMTKYLIGYFKIREVFQVDTSATEQSRHYSIRIARNNAEIDSSMLEAVEPQIRINAHFLRPSDRFICAVGNRIGMKGQQRLSLLLPEAIPLTEGWPFKPLPFAERVYGKLNYPRGHKWIPNDLRPDGLQTLLSRISELGE